MSLSMGVVMMKWIYGFFFLALCIKSYSHTLHYYPEAPLEVITIGHPTLSQIATEVDLDEILTPEFQQFLDDLTETMKKAGGVGIAAPQVNVSKRVFIMKSSWFKDPEAIINPVVEYIESKGTKNSTEGCLSIPGKQYKVKRYKEINLSYYNRDAEFVSERATGFRAIVAQHEYDHLNGVLIADFLYPELQEGEPREADNPLM